MSDQRKDTGQLGEQLVARYLEERGYSIVVTNARVGRDEIDIVARRNELLVFCEVRTRQRPSFVDPIATIDRAKVQRTRRAAAGWLRENRVSAAQIRFDAAAVVLEGGNPQISYYEAAF